MNAVFEGNRTAKATLFSVCNSFAEELPELQKSCQSCEGLARTTKDSFPIICFQCVSLLKRVAEDLHKERQVEKGSFAFLAALATLLQLWQLILLQLWQFSCSSGNSFFSVFNSF